MSAVLVTGATGFLGGRLCEDLLLSGREVIAIGRDRARLNYLSCLGASSVQCDLADPDCVDTVAAIAGGAGITGIVHCAALASAHGSLEAHHAANVTATWNVIRIAARLPEARLVHISTPSIQAALAHRFRIREDDPEPAPLNAYARTKKIAETRVLSTMADRAVILRPRGIYGRGDRALLPGLLAAARRGPLPLFDGGRAMTNLTHVDDVVASIHCALTAEAGLGGVYHVAHGEPLRIREIVERAAGAAGVPVSWRSVPKPVGRVAARACETVSALSGHEITPPLTTYLYALFAYSNTLNCDRARTDLGWRARISFDEGMRKTFTDIDRQGQ